MPNFHSLETTDYNKFDYLAVDGDTVELRCGFSICTFNLQTAEQIVETLKEYLWDKAVREEENRREYLDSGPEAQATSPEAVRFCRELERPSNFVNLAEYAKGENNGS